MRLPSADFKSAASADFAIRADGVGRCNPILSNFLHGHVLIDVPRRFRLHRRKRGYCRPVWLGGLLWLARATGSGAGLTDRRGIQPAIHFSIAQDCLDIFACLRKWDGFHKLRQTTVGPVGKPCFHAVVTGIVGGESIFRLAVEFIHQLAKIHGAEFQIHLRDQ